MRKYWLIAVVLVAGCSKAPAPQSGGGSGASGDGSAVSQGKGLQLTLHKVMDTEGTGKLAGTYLLPDGYTATDTVKWIPENYLTPVVGDIKLQSDDGQVQMEWMSGLQICFGHSPVGSTGIDPPKSVCAFLLDNWKKANPGLAFTVVDKKDTAVPEDAHTLPGGRMYGNRGIVQLSYVKDGTTFLAKLHARIDVTETTPESTPMGGTIYEGGWLILNAYTVIGPEAKFADAMKLYGIVLASYRMDRHFYNTVVQAQAIIMRNFYSQHRQIMETANIISQTNDRMIESMNRSYEASRAGDQKEAGGFDDYIRGIDRYNEGEGGEVSLPSGYNHAWSDGNGKYIVTDEHGYDPNVGGPNGSWHEMDKQP